MIRVVLDTNVLVSALLSSEGLPARVFLMAITSKEIQLCVSGDIYAEYDEVIRRPQFKRSAHEIEAALGAIRERGIWVKPS
jgi:putative PIN family toxin of toxin-antitoxin system